MIKLYELIMCSIILFILFLPMLIIAFLIKIDSKGPIIHYSKRIGKNKSEFFMPKFRTMYLDTPQLATHLLKNPNDHVTKIGKYLRKYSLDELPQIFSIFRGDMTFIGPRPALFNQKDLITKRDKLNINSLKPGITGLAQVNGRDKLSIDEKVSIELKYLNNKNLFLNISIIFKTIKKIFYNSEVRH